MFQKYVKSVNIETCFKNMLKIYQTYFIAPINIVQTNFFILYFKINFLHFFWKTAKVFQTYFEIVLLHLIFSFHNYFRHNC